jgi:hypothetical protein
VSFSRFSRRTRERNSGSPSPDRYNVAMCFDKLYVHPQTTRARKVKTVCGLMLTTSLVETCSHISLYYITHFVVSMTQLFCDLYKHHGIPKIKKMISRYIWNSFFAAFRNIYALISLFLSQPLMMFCVTLGSRGTMF